MSTASVYHGPGLFRELKAEQRKLHGRKMLLVPLTFLVFMFLWSFLVIRNPNAEDLSSGYWNLFYQLPLLNCILMPMMISVIASRVCDMEIKGSTLKMLFTLQKRGHFFDCKFIVGLKYMLVYVVGQGASILLFGKMYRFTQKLSLTMFLQFLMSTLCVGAALLLIQQMLSLLSNNQIIPLIVGIGGSFLGLFSMFFPENVTRLVVWAYFSVFSTVAMDWDRSLSIVTYYEVPFPLTLFLGFLAVLITAYLISKAIIQKKEV